MTEWYNLEDNYSEVFRQRRQAQNIWKYIPKKYYSAVTDAFADNDGYWIYLDHEKGGWIAYDGAEDCGMIHEYTIKDLKEAIKTIRKAV